MSKFLRSFVVLFVATIAFGGLGSQSLAQGADAGTVKVLNYYCSYLTKTMQLEAIDMAECMPGAATFTFYLHGDGTDAHWTLNTDANGEGVITLDAGDYEMVAEESQVHFDLTVTAGQNLQLLIGNPSGDVVLPAATGTILLQRFMCSYLDSTLLAEAIDQDECTPLAADFTFYIVGDGTADYYAAYTGTDGMGSAALPVGSYELVDEYSQTHFNVNVLEGENVVLLIAGPQSDAPAQLPEQKLAGQTSQPAVPTKLPNTGSGVDQSAGTMSATIAGTIAVVAIVGLACAGEVLRRLNEAA